MMLIIVTTIPTAPTTVSIIYVPFVKFPIRITSDNTGSSQNVPILAKGEPLTVLAAPTFIIRYRGLFSYEFLKNKYTKFWCWNWLFSRIWILCIFTKCPITCIFRLFTAKRFHRNSPVEPFYVSFYTTNSKNVLDQTVVKITVTETVHPGWTG